MELFFSKKHYFKSDPWKMKKSDYPRKRETRKYNLQNMRKSTLDMTSVWIAIHFFVTFDIFKWLYLAYYWVYLHQTWGFCKTWSTLYDYVDQ